MSKKIYLAGPDVFLKDEKIGLEKKKLCQEYGFEALYPLDNEISGENAAAQIYLANKQMIDEADIVLANISPFRGPHCDPGTAFEIGYAKALKKPVYTYTGDGRELIDRIREDYPDLVREEHNVEDFGHVENLMLAEASHLRCTAEHLKEELPALIAFEHTLKKIRDLHS